MVVSKIVVTVIEKEEVRRGWLWREYELYFKLLVGLPTPRQIQNSLT